MKNNKLILIIILLLAIAGAIGIFWYFTNASKTENNNYNAEKTSTNTNNSSNNSEAQTNTSKDAENQNNTDENSNNITEKKVPQFTEQPLSSYSTKIYSSDSARQNNINITCNTLNETVVKNGETFSFCNTVGMATTEKGYQKADIFDKDGNKKKGLGGGNCQISTTLYNAVLSVPSLTVTERHAHSNSVPYIEKGKDAAVAYGSYDLKFVNNSGHDVIIRCSSNGQTIDVSLISLI